MFERKTVRKANAFAFRLHRTKPGQQVCCLNTRTTHPCQLAATDPQAPCRSELPPRKPAARNKPQSAKSGVLRRLSSQKTGDVPKAPVRAARGARGLATATRRAAAPRQRSGAAAAQPPGRQLTSRRGPPPPAEGGRGRRCGAPRAEQRPGEADSGPGPPPPPPKPSQTMGAFPAFPPAPPPAIGAKPRRRLLTGWRPGLT